MANLYETIYRQSLDEPEAFWAEQAALIDWDRPCDKVLDDSHPPMYRWFSGGRLNTCFNALDRHVAVGRGDQPALVFNSAMTGRNETFSYTELLDQVALFAGVLANCGVASSIRVASSFAAKPPNTTE